MSTAINTPEQPINLSIVPFLRFLVSMPPDALAQFCRSLMECSEQIRADVLRMFEIAEDTSLSMSERVRALNTIADQLCLSTDNEGRFGMDVVASESAAAVRFPALAVHVETMNTQEAQFAECLRQLMRDKCVTQIQLAERIECTQPAISQMLNRKCRPQRKTLEKIAKALEVDVRELWPDLEVADYLDAVAEFQRDDHVMTEAEATSLRSTSKSSLKTQSKALPAWKDAIGTSE